MDPAPFKRSQSGLLFCLNCIIQPITSPEEVSLLVILTYLYRSHGRHSEKRTGPNWSRSIVQGKSYETNDSIGAELWGEVQHRLYTKDFLKPTVLEDGASLQGEEVARYGSDFLTRARLGQGTFRVLVTDAYARRCAITGERTLPVLEAAHIKPFGMAGPNQTINGLLLRSDLHKLFDLGYMTITPGLAVKVSGNIREKFKNGRDYYALDGRELTIVPSTEKDRPSSQYLQWHNRNVFLG